MPTQGHHPRATLQAPQPRTLTHHPFFSRRVVPHHQHHGAAGNERKGHGQGWCWALPPCIPRAVPERLLPQSLGVGHSPRPVDVQVPAAGREEGESQCEPLGRHCHGHRSTELGHCSGNGSGKHHSAPASQHPAIPTARPCPEQSPRHGMQHSVEQQLPPQAHRCCSSSAWQRRPRCLGPLTCCTC